jgi:hypothetical protein
MVKLNLRTKSIGTRVSEQEYARLERAAQKDSKTLAEWCREVMLSSANGGAAETAVAGARAEALIAEVVALRAILLNVLFEHPFRKLARKLGIPDALKLYCARHTFGTVAMAETRNPGLVKEVMGHESLDTTMGYLHPETSQIKVVIDRLNQQKYLM